MGVKSTVTLTRDEALLKYIELNLSVYDMSDSDLEDLLEQLNDLANGGEGFENYQIRD